MHKLLGTGPSGPVEKTHVSGPICLVNESELRQQPLLAAREPLPADGSMALTDPIWERLLPWLQELFKGARATPKRATL